MRSRLLPVPLENAMLSKRVKVVDDPATVLMYIPLVSVSCTARR